MTTMKQSVVIHIPVTNAKYYILIIFNLGSLILNFHHTISTTHPSSPKKKKIYTMLLHTKYRYELFDYIFELFILRPCIIIVANINIKIYE